MAIDIKQARQVLKAAGVRNSSLYGLAWPFGREKKVLALLRERRALLETKNNTVDFLFRTQSALAELDLADLADVRAAMQDPSKKPVIMTVGVSRAMLEEELASQYGSETGRSLDDALVELLAEGVLLQVPARDALSTYDIYLAVFRLGRPHYDTSQLSQMLREGRRYADELRARARREESTKRGRTYRM